MNQSSPRSFSKPAASLLLTTLFSLAVTGACSSDSNTAEAPLGFTFAITKLDGQAPDQPVNLRCDEANDFSCQGICDGAVATHTHSTLAVEVSMSTEPSDAFVLRPANACGTSLRCGYFRIEGLDESGRVLAHVDTSTTAGVLEVELADLPALSQIRASVRHGFDQTIVQDIAKNDVVSVVSPPFVPPTDCVLVLPDTTQCEGSGGAGGAPACASYATPPGSGGAANGGEPNGGAPNGGANSGAGGDTPAAGAGGEAPMPAVGGAGGEPAAASSGAGGV